jgi:hypothetical protein
MLMRISMLVNFEDSNGDVFVRETLESSYNEGKFLVFVAKGRSFRGQIMSRQMRRATAEEINNLNKNLGIKQDEGLPRPEEGGLQNTEGQ